MTFLTSHSDLESEAKKERGRWRATVRVLPSILSCSLWLMAFLNVLLMMQSLLSVHTLIGA